MGPRTRAAVLATVLASVAAVPASAAPPSAVRTGGPSAPADAKRAVVLSDARLVGRPFTVTSAAGRVVLRGRLRAATGSAQPWRHAAIADLSAVRAHGAYRVRAAGLTAARRWVVADGAAGEAVRTVLRFLAVNADGTEHSPAHLPSHLADATLPDGTHADLTGGWMDAGDTLKFTGANAYAVVALLLAARLDPAEAPALTDAAGVGVRWLRKAHPAPGVFVSQVGDIRVDHRRDPARGFDPADDDRSPASGLARRRALTGIGTDSGGRVAAALALAAQTEVAPVRRAELVTEARAWYDAGRTAGRLAPRLPQDPYPSGSGADDMALGATELHRATGDPALLAEATAWLARAEPGETATWDAVGPLAAAELCGIASPAGCSFVRDAAGHAARRAHRHVLATAGVLTWGTTTMQGGAGATLAMAGSDALAADARDWMLGRNPWGASFVAGLGPDAPVHMHHWAARWPARLRGAVVGGPTTRAVLREERIRYRPNRFDGPAGVYEDRAADYVTSEPAIVYAASAVLLFAAMAG
jgi:endoglucanase